MQLNEALHGNVQVTLLERFARGALPPGLNLLLNHNGMGALGALDPDLKDGDISVQYDHLVIDRLLECEFGQLREQLVAQFPDSLLDS